MFSYVKLILLKIQDSLMLGTVYDSSILYIKIKWLPEKIAFLNLLFCFDSYEIIKFVFVHSDSLLLFDQISLLRV